MCASRKYPYTQKGPLKINFLKQSTTVRSLSGISSGVGYRQSFNDSASGFKPKNLLFTGSMDNYFLEPHYGLLTLIQKINVSNSY